MLSRKKDRLKVLIPWVPIEGIRGIFVIEQGLPLEAGGVGWYNFIHTLQLKIGFGGMEQHENGGQLI